MAKLVNQVDFSLKIKDKKLTVFSARDLQTLFGVSNIAATFLLHRYTKRNIIVRLRRGLYALPDALPPELYLANKLYSPSYVSREFALSYHGVIPETVYEITSVTTRARAQFQSLGKIYSYRKIKQKAFTGYILTKQQGFNFLIADAEKAFVDTLYYRVLFNKKPISRFNEDKIDKKKVLEYAKLFDNPKLVEIVKQTLK